MSGKAVEYLEWDPEEWNSSVKNWQKQKPAEHPAACRQVFMDLRETNMVEDIDTARKAYTFFLLDNFECGKKI